MENEGHCYVYMLRCADQSLYTGWTKDLRKRLKKHRLGVASKYTRARLPVELVYFEECSDPSTAMKRECAIKKLTKALKEEMVRSAMCLEAIADFGGGFEKREIGNIV